VAGATPPTVGLVGHWAFDEGAGTTAADSSGNGLDGTLQYSPGWATNGSCHRGACISFDGSDDYVRIPDSAALRLTGDLTVSAWIRPTGARTLQSVVSKRYEFELGPVSNLAPYPLRWSHKQEDGTLVSGELAPAIESEQWQHVVLVRDGAAKQLRGYKNGALAASSGYATPPGTSTYALNIGRNPGGNQRFRGLIDEVRLYNRALSAAEVQELYNQAAPAGFFGLPSF
jgi:large repetitive protein